MDTKRTIAKSFRDDDPVHFEVVFPDGRTILDSAGFFDVDFVAAQAAYSYQNPDVKLSFRQLNKKASAA